MTSIWFYLGYQKVTWKNLVYTKKHIYIYTYIDVINLDPLHQGTTKAIPQQKSSPSQLLKSTEQDMRGFREQSPKRKNKWYQNPQPTQKCGINYIYTHINYIHAYEHKHISTWQNNRYTRKLIVTSISFFASYGWPPGRGRSFEVGTSKLRLFAKVGLRMGLAITSGFVGGFNMFQPKNHLILTGKSFSQTSNLQFFRFHVNV